MNRPPYFFWNKIALGARVSQDIQKKLILPDTITDSTRSNLSNLNCLAASSNYRKKRDFLQGKVVSFIF